MAKPVRRGKYYYDDDGYRMTRDQYREIVDSAPESFNSLSARQRRQTVARKVERKYTRRLKGQDLKTWKKANRQVSKQWGKDFRENVSSFERQDAKRNARGAGILYSFILTPAAYPFVYSSMKRSNIAQANMEANPNEYYRAVNERYNQLRARNSFKGGRAASDASQV